MPRYRKSDVTFHGDWSSSAVPAVNVKVHNFPSISALATALEVDEATAARAASIALECHQETFWEEVQDTAREILREPVKVYAGGRSGGWVEVHNLPDVEQWDAIALGRWVRFERTILREVAYLTSHETILETILANGYHEA